jgi:hypothetical protein
MKHVSEVKIEARGNSIAMGRSEMWGTYEGMGTVTVESGSRA